MTGPLQKAYVKPTFLQTGAAKHDVYLIPRRKWTYKRFMWYLKTAVYYLENCNPKWQKMSHHVFHDIGLVQYTSMPQLLYANNTRCDIAIFFANIVETIILSDVPEYFERLLDSFHGPFTQILIASRSGALRFYLLHIMKYKRTSVPLSMRIKSYQH